VGGEGGEGREEVASVREGSTREGPAVFSTDVDGTEGVRGLVGERVEVVDEGFSLAERRRAA